MVRDIQFISPPSRIDSNTHQPHATGRQRTGMEETWDRYKKQFTSGIRRAGHAIEHAGHAIGNAFHRSSLLNSISCVRPNYDNERAPQAPRPPRSNTYAAPRTSAPVLFHNWQLPERTTQPSSDPFSHMYPPIPSQSSQSGASGTMYPVLSGSGATPSIYSVLSERCYQVPRQTAPSHAGEPPSYASLFPPGFSV